MTTLKASPQGLVRIKQARKEQGWPVTDSRWLTAASRVLKSKYSGKLADGISLGTWKRFLAGKQPVNAQAFQAYCQVLGFHWEQLVEHSHHQDWGDAPDVAGFWGRTSEIQILKRWILHERCPLIGLLGMGGIGKTALAARVAQEIQDQFEWVIWRSLRFETPLNQVLRELLRLFSSESETQCSDNLNVSLQQLLKHLQSQRCLLILDNLETLLQTGNFRSSYRKGFQAYGQFFQQMCATAHNSCLLLTSREPPLESWDLGGRGLMSRYLQLEGLPEAVGRTIVAAKVSLSGSELEWQALHRRYGGNPLALKIASTTIHSCFAGSIGHFLEILQQGYLVLDEIQDVLNQQFQHLPSLEQQLMVKLAHYQQPVALEAFQSDLADSVSFQDLIESLVDLQRRSLITTRELKLTLQPFVMDYVNYFAGHTQVAQPMVESTRSKG